jgi:hypothetical protein
MFRFVTHTFQYGPAACQAGELYLPEITSPPVVCLLQGGFWRLPHGRDQMHAIACDLAGRGYAVWNVGYRRIGERGAGWPGTFDDVSVGLNHVADLAGRGIGLNLDQVAVAGHSPARCWPCGELAGKRASARARAWRSGWRLFSIWSRRTIAIRVRGSLPTCSVARLRRSRCATRWRRRARCCRSACRSGYCTGAWMIGYRFRSHATM